MTLVMAWDIATVTGIAFGSAGETPRATHVDLGKGLSDAERFAKMIAAAEALLGRHKPDLVVYEAPIGGPKTSHYLVGIAACFMGQARRMGHNPKPLNLSQVRKHFLGRHMTERDFPGYGKARARKAIKQLVLDRCKLLKWDAATDDEADAMACWDFACATMCGAQSAPSGRLFND